MNSKTLEYIKGRFKDYYRKTEIDPPPEYKKREWGYISFKQNMHRHLSLFDIGSIQDWLIRENPQHVYYSSALYDRPGSREMQQKKWKGADLIFDLDADHLTNVEKHHTYPESLEICKQELLKLISFLEDDFGFEKMEIVFSGGRGYHVHIRDETARKLDGEGRREIVDYIEGNNLDLDSIIYTERVEGKYGTESAQIRKLKQNGWASKARDYIKTLVDKLNNIEEKEAKNNLKNYEGIGEKRAEKIYKAFIEHKNQIKKGNIDTVGIPSFWEEITKEAIQKNKAEIDEPVTTDTRRLIRLPGSLHGGTGLKVQRIEKKSLKNFKPLQDSIAFSDHKIDIKPKQKTQIHLKNQTFTLKEKTTLPEYAAIYAILTKKAKLA